MHIYSICGSKLSLLLVTAITTLVPYAPHSVPQGKVKKADVTLHVERVIPKL